MDPPFDPGTASAPPPAASAFSHRAFTVFWGARCLSSLAVQAESVTLGWQVYTLSRHTRGVAESALMVGWLGLAQFAPLFLLCLVGGASADRHDRRALVLACTLAEIACALALAGLARYPRGPAPIFAVAALFGASRAFLSPAATALGPMLVPPEALPQAVSWNALGDQAGSILGPFVGGALCALSPAYGYLGAAVLYGAAAAGLLAVTADTRPRPQPGSRLEQIRAGIAYVRGNPVVLGALSLDLFAVLLGGATALLPVFADDVLHVGARGFGLLRAGPALGGAAMAFALGRRPLRRRAGLWLFLGVAAFGMATLVFALSRSLAVSVAALTALGAADMVSVYVRQTLVQVSTPDAMRGRVSAVSGLFIGASAELGEFESGLAARVLGPVGAALFGGLGSLAVTAAWAKIFPALRKADRLDLSDGGTPRG